MKVFKYELKKIWSWQVVGLIIGLGILIWFSTLRGVLQGQQSLLVNGQYGAYPQELFQLYGDVLDEEELLDYDIPGKKAAILAEIETKIQTDPIFAENGLHSYAEYQKFEQSGAAKDLTQRQQQELDDLKFTMYQKLDQLTSKLQQLEAVETRFTNSGEKFITAYIKQDERPIAVKAAKEILANHNHNLIAPNLAIDFSQYGFIVGVYTILATILLVAPMITGDRQRRIHVLQYSTKTGRKILKIQLAATFLSSFLLNLLLIGGLILPFILANKLYWSAHMQGYTGFGFQLYNITFGAYVWLIMGMIFLLSMAAAGIAFIIARFSSNIILLLIKAVPVGLALWGVSFLSINFALTDNNFIFIHLLRGSLVAPEVAVCGVIFLLSMLGVSWLILKEKRVAI